MAALLLSRMALVPRSLSRGAIAGVVLGVVIGVLILILILLLVLPFLPCVRRRWQHESDLALTESGLGPRPPGFLSATKIGNTIRRLSHSVPHRSAVPVSGAGSDTGDSTEKPERHVHALATSDADKYGLPSVVGASLEETPEPGLLPRIPAQAGGTAVASLPLAAHGTRTGSGPVMPSREDTLKEDSKPTATGASELDIRGLITLPSRQVTFGSQRTTEEPEPLSAGGLSEQSSQSRKRSYHLSDSLRHLAQVASAAMRRDSTRSTDSVRSRGSFGSPKVLQRPDVLAHTHTAPPILEPDLIDTEAPGLAYDYYHPSLHDHPRGLEHSASYGPPLTIPDTFVEPSVLPSSFISPTSDASVDQRTPASLVHGLREGQNTLPRPIRQEEWFSVPLNRRRESGEGDDGAPRPLGRTDTQPLQSFVSDLIPNTPLPSAEQLLVDPRSVMKATTRSELDYNVKQKLAGLDAPSPVGTAAASNTPPHPSQQTPDPTPEPDPESFQERVIQSRTYTELPWSSAPDININRLDTTMAHDHHTYVGADIVMEGSENWDHPSSGETYTPDQRYHTPHSMPTPDVSIPPSQPITPYLGGLSPESSVDSSARGHNRRASGQTNPGSERTSQSPGNFPCHECDRVFDQLHKLHHHTRYHERPHKCTYAKCGQAFGTKTHLERHVNDKHNNTKRFYCYYPNCQYGPQGKGFPRKDNWRRHMQNKHDVTNPPEPQAVESLGGQNQGYVNAGILEAQLGAGHAQLPAQGSSHPFGNGSLE